MKRLISRLMRAMFPGGVQCLNCGLGSPGGLLCAECAAELDALRIPAETGDTRAVWRYDGCAGRMVRLLKDECRGDCATVLAAGMAEVLREMALPPDTVLTWSAMPEKRRRERGIDHARTLCEALGKATGMPVRALLRRQGKVHTQRGLSREQRLHNLQGTFLCDEALHAPVLLIDDVLTTGATAAACREALLKQGAPRVFVLTATRVTERSADR